MSWGPSIYIDTHVYQCAKAGCLAMYGPRTETNVKGKIANDTMAERHYYDYC